MLIYHKESGILGQALTRQRVSLRRTTIVLLLLVSVITSCATKQVPVTPLPEKPWVPVPEP